MFLAIEKQNKSLKNVFKNTLFSILFFLGFGRSLGGLGHAWGCQDGTWGVPRGYQNCSKSELEQKLHKLCKNKYFGLRKREDLISEKKTKIDDYNKSILSPMSK